jgi:copper transport protein
LKFHPTHARRRTDGVQPLTATASRYRGRVKAVVAVTVAVAALLVAPAAAFAHATLLRSEPAAGSSVASSPHVVRLVFDDSVRVGPGIEAVRNGGGSVLAGRARTQGRVETVPLRPNLPDGVYSVRWSVVSDDGHIVEGVVPFRVGPGGAAEAGLRIQSTDRPADVAARWAFLLGVLLAGGTALVHLIVGAPRAGRGLLAVGYALTVAGAAASLALQPTTRTRYALTQEVAIGVAAAGLLLLGATRRGRRPVRDDSRPRAGAAVELLPALGLLVLPTLGGHALDPGRSRVEVPLDLAHVTGAALWIGGLAALVSTPELAGRVSRTAVAAVALLVVTGPLRALGELSAVHQLWTTGYGRALIVKSGLLLALVALGFANRRRLSRRRLAAELVLLAVLVAVVGFLTDSRPGRRAALAAVAARGPAPLPPTGALVLAREDGPWAVALAVRGRETTVTAIGQDGNGVDGLQASIAGAAAAACGPGCYRADLARVPRRVVVRLGDSRVEFPVPARAPPARAVAERATRAFRALRSVEFVERLASGAGAAITTRWVEQAPNRLSYRIVRGPQAVVIGARRWDRVPGGRWVESQTESLPFPTPPWAEVSNARLIGSTRGTQTVAFLDRSIPAWFEVVVDRRTGLPLRARMTATAHFMRHVYGRFDAAPPVEPPR